jgi:hypothetical protein
LNADRRSSFIVASGLHDGLVAAGDSKVRDETRVLAVDLPASSGQPNIARIFRHPLPGIP